MALALVGCNTRLPVDPDGGLDADPDADPNADPNCHFDCFGALECRDGKAIAWAHTPVPCWAWTGRCPRTEVTCAGGCALEFYDDRVVEYGRQTLDGLRALCAETPLAAVGDRCDESGCVPVRAATAEDGTARLTYLACELATRTCTVTGAPVIDRYLEGCPLAAASLGRNLQEGVVSVTPRPTFDLQWCLVARNDAGDVRHGLTLSCIGDWDCPASSTCDTFRDTDFGDLPVALCRPGPRGTKLFDRLP